jgi:hypothetical protein
MTVIYTFQAAIMQREKGANINETGGQPIRRLALIS